MISRPLASTLWWICATIVILGIRIGFHKMAWFQALPPLGGWAVGIGFLLAGFSLAAILNPWRQTTPAPDTPLDGD